MNFKIDNCNMRTCEYCQYATLSKTSLIGIMEYICPPFPRAHKALKGEFCRSFICNNSSDSPTCGDCNKKVLKR